MFRHLFALVIAGCVFQTPVFGAIVTLSEKNECAIELTGPIAEGDVSKVVQAATKAGLTELSEGSEPDRWYEDALCLDSPGGSYAAGRAISMFLREFGIPTRLLPGAECYSACAFVFMSGRLFGGETDTTARVMDVTAKLGFHAPYFAFGEDEAFTGTEANELVVASSKLIADFIKQGSSTSRYGYKSIFPISLVTEMLAAGPDELASVDTIEDAARWDISLSGYRDEGLLDEPMMIMACDNFQAWALDKVSQPPADMSFGLPLSSVSHTIYGRDAEFAVVPYLEESGGYCHIERQSEPSEYISICAENGNTGLSYGNCRDGYAMSVEWYYGLPPGTPISTLSNR